MGVEVPSLADYTRWRRKAGPEVIRALGLYARYCSGQFAGMGEALNMSAVRFLCEAEAIPVESWGSKADEMCLIHSVVMARSKAEKANG